MNTDFSEVCVEMANKNHRPPIDSKLTKAAVTRTRKWFGVDIELMFADSFVVSESLVKP